MASIGYCGLGNRGEWSLQLDGDETIDEELSGPINLFGDSTLLIGGNIQPNGKIEIIRYVWI